MSDGDKISFSELDKRRREKKSGNGQRGPRGERAQRRSRAATAAYKRRVEEHLFGRSGDAPRMRLEQRLRESHDTPNFLRIYREYVKGYGMPERFPVLLLLLDLEDEREVLRVVEALGIAASDAAPEQKNLLRSRLRNLEMSASSDALADAAKDLLARL
jgi:hypothetical protein